MEIHLKPCAKAEQRQTEEITREAFWTAYVPGCSEHLLLHRLRNSPQFIPELDFVALHEGKVVGCIAYARTGIIRQNGDKLPVITFGPVGVIPTCQHRGIGSRLIVETLQKAAALGHRAVLIYGDPAYYERFGFMTSKHYGITNREGRYPAALLAKGLIPGALADAAGIFDEGDAYSLPPDDLDQFDQTFPQKEKEITETQRQFEEMAGRYL